MRGGKTNQTKQKPNHHSVPASYKGDWKDSYAYIKNKSVFTTEAPLFGFSSTVIHNTYTAMQNKIKTFKGQEVL